MSARSLALAVASILAVEGRADADTVGMLVRQGLGIDLDVAGGVRVHAGDGDATRLGFARIRAGVLLFDEPTFLGLGIAAQLGPLASSSLGVELRYTEVFHGLFAQAGVFPIDSIGGTTLELQAGWTLVGLEYQRRVSGPRDHDQALVVVLQVPLGVIYQMTRDPPGLASR